MADTTVSLIIRGIDRLTGPAKKMRREVDKLHAAALPQRFGKLGKALGLDEVAKSWRGVGAAAGNVRQQAAGALGTVLKLGAAAAGAGFAFKKAFIDPAAQFEVFQQRLDALEGSGAGGKRAMEWIRDFSRRTPIEIGGVTEAFLQLRQFGMNPTDGSMQAIVDTTANLGGSQEKLLKITELVGKAWGKQKLGSEEVQSLQEQGVPVFDLLSQASGRSAKSLLELSQKGRLGRSAISLLVKEMGKANAGGAQAGMRTWGGLMAQLSNRWTDFSLRVMDSGLFDFLKGKIEVVLGQLDKWAADGSLERWARDFAGGIESVVTGIGGAIESVGGLGNALTIVGVIMSARTLLAVGQLGGSLVSLGMNAHRTYQVLAKVGALGKAATVLRAVWASTVLLGKGAIGAAAGLGKMVIAALPAALPFLAIGAAVGALGLAIHQLVKHWDELDFLEGIKGIASSLGESGVLSTLGELFDPRTLLKDIGVMGSSAPLATAGPPVPLAGAGQTNVGGTVKLEVTSNGARTKVKQIQSSGGIDLAVSTGLALAGGGL